MTDEEDKKKAANKRKHKVIRDRLEFVEMITALRPQFCDRQTQMTAEGGWTHRWLYFDALRNYLLLTCFDLLGQPQNYMSFGSWLKSDDIEPQRTAALARATSFSVLLDQIKMVHSDYLAAYGTTNSFKRFVKDVLPPEVRANLYHSVMIRKIDPVTNTVVAETTTFSDDKKLDFLYTIRNAFTHTAVNAGSPAGGVWAEWDEWRDIDGSGVLKKGYVEIYRVERDGFHFEYSVRDWPDVLSRAVESGLSLMEGCAEFDRLRSFFERSGTSQA